MQKKIELGNLTQQVLNDKFQKIEGLKGDLMLILDNKGLNLEELLQNGGNATLVGTFDLVIITPDDQNGHVPETQEDKTLPLPQSVGVESVEG